METTDHQRARRFAEELRVSYRAMIPSAGPPDDVTQVRTIGVPATRPTREVPVRVYVPATSATATPATAMPMVVFAHGGCFVAGDFDTHDVVIRALANRTHALVLAVDYRLAPEHPFPAGLEDVYEVLTWAAEHAHEIGGDPRRIALAGDSAGGNLAAATAMLARDRGGPRVAAQLLIYPMISHAMDTASWRRLGDTHFPMRSVGASSFAAYVPPDVDPGAPLVAPLWGRHDHLPPALVQVGALDPLHDEGHAYAARLAAAGVDAKGVTYPESTHGFIQFFKDRSAHPHGERALQDGAAFLVDKLAVRA